MTLRHSGRRSSVMGKGAGAKADPRPVTNKAFMQESIHHLITFLMENDYQQRISPKILTNPTGKDFQNIVTFLFRLIDGSYQMSGRLEEEVPLVFKALRYPFGISKTGLTAVGSPHTWPALLASLMWMIELLEYDQDVRRAEEDGEAAGGDEKFFFNYLQQSYAAFLSGDDDTFQALDEEIAQTFQSKQEEIRSDVTRMQEENDAMRKEIAELEEQEAELPKLREQKADFESDREKFLSLIRQLEQHREALQRKIDARTEELEEKESELAAAEERLATVQRQVDEQELSTKDVEAMEQRKHVLREQLESLGKDKEDIQQQVLELELEVTKALHSLEGRVQEYNSMASQLQLLPPDDENANGIDFELCVNQAHLSSLSGSGVGGSRRQSNAVRGSRGPSSAGLLGQDMKRVIKPALRELKATFVTRIHETRTESFELQEQLESMQEELDDMKHQKADLSKRAKSLEDAHRREKEALEEHLSRVSEEMEELEEAIAEARSDLQTRTVSKEELSERMLTRWSQEASREAQELQQQRSQRLDAIFRAMMTLTNHKETIQNKLADLRATMTVRVPEF